MQNLIEDFHSIGWSSVPRSLIFYTAGWGDAAFNSQLGIYRNSGFFHEPGAYGIILNLAIIINTFTLKSIYNRKNVVFFICLISTFSTAAYISFFIILVGYFLQLSKIGPFKIIIATAIIIPAFWIYNSANFLKDKIEVQYKDQKFAAESGIGSIEGHSGRFYAFFSAINEIRENPVFGRGILYSSTKKAQGMEHLDTGTNYGLLKIISIYGLLFGCYFIKKFYDGYIVICKSFEINHFYSITTFISLNLALMSQYYITTSIFMVFFIQGVLNYRPKKIEKVL